MKTQNKIKKSKTTSQNKKRGQLNTWQKLQLKLGRFFYPALGLLVVVVAGGSAFYAYQQNISGAGTKVDQKTQGRVLIYNNEGRFQQAAIGVSTIKGTLEGPVTNQNASCIYNGKTHKLADLPGQYLYVSLPKGNGARSLVCSSSSYHVYYLKRGQKVNDANQYTRAAPSVVAGNCTYLTTSLSKNTGINQDTAASKTEINKIDKMKRNGTCPSIKKALPRSADKQKAILTARYEPAVIKIGQPYKQIFELHLASGEWMSPKECAGQIAISHPGINTPARNYSIRYYDTAVERAGKPVKVCRFVQNISAKASGKYTPKQDSLELTFSGNAFVEPAKATLKVDRRR